MPDKPVVMLVGGGGGGAPQIPQHMPGTPGVREVAEMCSGPEYNYLQGMKDPAVLRQGHNPKPSKKQVADAFADVYANPPSTLGKGQTQAERRKQMTAIALNKARKG